MSAIVTSDSMALVFLPIALVAQMVLSGAFLAVEQILLTLLAWLTPRLLDLLCSRLIQ